MYYILIFCCVIIVVIIHTYIMGKKKNNKSRINFCQFYRQNSKYYFPLKSTFPLLNYAFPDSSCEYYMMTFKYDKYNISFKGFIPKEKIYYFSLTIYDKYGMVLYSINDKKLSEKYTLKFQFLVDVCVIIRFYKKPIYQKESFYKYLPQVEPRRKKITQKQIIKNSRNIEKKIFTMISKKPLTIDKSIEGINYFLLPAKQNIHSMFVNKDATYMVAIPYTTIGRIELSKINLQCSYIGFMCCNSKTTETDSTFSVHRKRRVRLWFCYKKDVHLIKKFGYRENYDGIITWKNTNKNPILIYREINIFKSNLNSINNKKTNYTKTKLLPIMKSFYPNIEYF